ncbi:hypothetical protein JCM8208_004696 [Rhodotorula glutinis]
MSFGGPGSAFSFAAPTRPSRRGNGTSGSFRDAAASAANSSSPAAHPPSSAHGGPSPVVPPAQPSLGAFSPGAERDSFLQNGANGTSHGHDQAPHQQQQHHQQQQQPQAPRSFSAIVSPGASANGADGVDGDSGVAGKPFVYSRELLLSLYDEDKAKRRPIELATHETATRDLSGSSGASHKPWLLQDYREGEKELFSTSIHPPNVRPSRLNRTDSSLSAAGPTSNGASATLDLSSLGTLPRDRDRGLGSPSLRSPSIEKDILAAGRDRRTRERSAGPPPLGITGGVLGGILGSVATPAKKKDELAAGTGASGEKKDGVWQGGRWRRTAQEAEEAEKQRTSAFGSRRFPLPDDESRASSLGDNGAVPDAWEEGNDNTPPTGSAALNGEALSNEPDLAASVLGSLALDDPSDDALLTKPSASSGAATPSRAAPPPGLGAFPPAEVMWQYRDPSGQVQGPFSASTMHDWYRQQFFTPDLRVKRTTDTDFESLENLVRRTGDSEKPFLAPKPSAPTSAFSSAPGTPQGASSWGASSARAQTPLEQLTAAVAQGRFGGAAPGSSLYEAFGSAAPSPAPEPQTLPQSAFGQAPSSLDPWGAPLPSAGGAPSWNGLGGAGLGQQQQQHLFQPQQPLASPGAPLQSPMDLLRQLAQQQQGQQLGQQQQQQQQQPFGQQGLGHDMFGRPSLPSSPFFDPSQLAPGAGSASPSSWLHQQLPQQQQHMQQPQQPWASLTGNQAAMSPLAQFAQAPGAGAPSPIGRPAQVQSPFAQPAQQQQQQQQQQQAPQQPQSPWGSVQQPQQAPAVEQQEAPRVAELAPPIPIVPVSAPAAEQAKPTPAPVETPKPAATKAASPVVQAKPAPAPAAQAAEPSPSPSPAPSASSKAGASAPWAKEEKVAAVAPAAPSPSLREIQEAEAREAAKRKEAARVQAAQANIQAAQRAAALEAQQAAETLPSSASWAAGPAQVPAPKAPVGGAAPWVKPAAAASPVAAAKTQQKTLKEIQEEEEKRKKAQLAAQQQAGQPAVGKGYAGTAQQGAPQVGGAWTTVAVKPAVVGRPAAPGAKPVVPGLPSTATSSTAARVASTTALPAKPAASPAPAAAAAAARPAAASVITAAVPARSSSSAPRSVNVNGSSSATTVYDMENPPPPSPEFLSWTKQALKGLNVPLDEFIQMLLSFPLEASADVLEIISDSVYANSSTLDGRRFATDFTTRRKNDVAVRYPSIFAKGTVRTAGKPSSMAAVLAATPAPKVSEWNIKVSQKKKKGGAK